MGASAIEPGKDYARLGPTLPAEMSRTPFRPEVAGRMAFFFSPVAGALVSVISLRRMGYPVKAKRIFLWTLLAAAVLAVVLLGIPDIAGRAVGFGAEISCYLMYPRLQETEFAEWEAAHPEVAPSSGWGALGWGIAGLALFFVIFVAVAVPMSYFFPSLG